MSFLSQETGKNSGSRVELYLFETEDNKYRWAYTTDAAARFFGAVEYIPEVISRGELKQQAGDSSVEKLRVTVPFDNPVAVAHVPYLPPRPVKVTIFAYHRNDPGSEVVQAFVGYVTSFNQKGAEAELECSQIIDSLGQSVPWVVFKSDCNWALYQIGCGVDKGAYQETLTDVNAVDGTLVTAPTLAGFPPHWFRNGFAYHPSTGESRFITAHDDVAGTITLVYPFLSLAPGDVLDVFAGCDRKKETCLTKFNNKENYLGFDHFPTYNVFQQGIT